MRCQLIIASALFTVLVSAVPAREQVTYTYNIDQNDRAIEYLAAYLKAYTQKDYASAVSSTRDNAERERILGAEASMAVAGVNASISRGEQNDLRGTASYLDYISLNASESITRRKGAAIFSGMNYFGIGTEENRTRALDLAAIADQADIIPELRSGVDSMSLFPRLLKRGFPVQASENAALLLISRDHLSVRFNSQTLYINDEKIPDSRWKRHQVIAIYIAPGRYRLDSAPMWGAANEDGTACRMEPPYELLVSPVDVIRMHVGWESRKPNQSSVCGLYSKVLKRKSVEQLDLEPLVIGDVVTVGFPDEDHIRLLDNTAVDKIRSARTFKLLQALHALEMESLSVIEASLARLKRERDVRLSDLNRRRLEGDGSEEDALCKRKGFRPATVDYNNCYANGLTARRDREREAAARQEVERRRAAEALARADRERERARAIALEIAERERARLEIEARDPFSDAKKKCTALGIKPKTEAFGKCVLEVSRP
jgi:hypothetical protein